MAKMDQAQIDSFWQARQRFLHTCLSTEAPLVKTHNLSTLCNENVAQAIALFKQVELDALGLVDNHIDSITTLAHNIHECISNGGNVYISGCGASARLAVLLQKLWNDEFPQLIGRVIAICSGGDVSLIHSLEQFEDSLTYGVSQLTNSGFSNKDLLLGLSASGESPFIIAGIEYAADGVATNSLKPWLVCNNRIHDLIQRNAKHIATNKNVHTLALDVGAMALTGSTRLQATSAMQLAIASALIHHQQPQQIARQLQHSQAYLTTLDLSQLHLLTTLESEIIRRGEYILYRSNNNLLALSLLADITERSPTFNIAALENYATPPAQLSQFYLSLSHISNISLLWQELLQREANCLNVPSIAQTSNSYFYGFDISNISPRLHTTLDKPQHHALWNVNSANNLLEVSLQDVAISFTLAKDNITRALMYKLILNAHSTIMFGRLGAFSGNLMLSLKPSNHKLIDRAIRYALYILKTQYQQEFSYETVANTLFAEVDSLANNESIVNKVVQRLLRG